MSNEARAVAVQTVEAYRDMVDTLSGGEAEHAHEHLLLHLELLTHSSMAQTAFQARFALPVLQLLMLRVLADPPDPTRERERDCTAARQFVVDVVGVMSAALGHDRGSRS